MTPTPEDHEAAARRLLWSFDDTGAEVPSWPARLKLVALIAAALAEAVRVARQEEREACARTICQHCAAGRRLSEQDQSIRWWHPPTATWGWIACPAADIHNRSVTMPAHDHVFQSPESGERQCFMYGCQVLRPASTEAQAMPAPDRCPHCSFSPESASDYCDEHRPKAWGTPPETKERG